MAKPSDRVNIRYTIPKKAHKKIRSHMRRLIAQYDKDITMEEALIDILLAHEPIQAA